MDTERRSIAFYNNVLYVVRWAIIIIVLLESQFSFKTANMDRPAIFVAIISIAAITLAVTFVPKRFKENFEPIVVVIADILFVSTIVYYSDGLQSPFFSLYYITVLTAAAILGTPGGVGAAAITSLIIVAIEFVTTKGGISDILVLDDVLITFPYLFLAGIIAGALRQRIQFLAELMISYRLTEARRENEMDVARRVQQAQFPSELPSVEGVDVAVLYKPAREVGGDIYDFYPVLPGTFGVLVADVSGKGVPAALSVSGAKYSLIENYKPGDLPATISGVNHHLMSVTTEDSFVTLLYGILNVETREFRYVNAGHMPPIVLKAMTGDALRFKDTDIPAGISKDASYTERSIMLESGDTLILYSDGVTDALETQDAGISELCEIIESLQNLDLQDWSGEILKHIDKPLHTDDATFVAIRLL